MLVYLSVIQYTRCSCGIKNLTGQNEFGICPVRFFCQFLKPFYLPPCGKPERKSNDTVRNPLIKHMFCGKL